MMHSSFPHQKPEQVYFFHLRKAGGASLKQYLSAYASQKQIPVQFGEGYSLNHTRWFRRLNRDRLLQLPSTLPRRVKGFR